LLPIPEDSRRILAGSLRILKDLLGFLRISKDLEGSDHIFFSSFEDFLGILMDV